MVPGDFRAITRRLAPRSAGYCNNVETDGWQKLPRADCGSGGPRTCGRVAWRISVTPGPTESVVVSSSDRPIGLDECTIPDAIEIVVWTSARRRLDSAAHDSAIRRFKDSRSAIHD